jgi:hypothetical protein
VTLVTVVGRGHGGTRAMSRTLSESGVYMGAEVNESSDLVPPEDMYEACRVIARHVRYVGDLCWDFARLHTMRIDPAFRRLIESYLASVLASKSQLRGWKIPETALCYPWIVRLFPEARFILWSRDPRDAILGEHLTDDLSLFDVPWPRTDDVLAARAVSWLYQAQIVDATPPPAHLASARFEDFVLRQQRTLTRLEKFLGFPLARLPVNPEAVGRWKRLPERPAFPPFLLEALPRYGYGARTRAA